MDIRKELALSPLLLVVVPDADDQNEIVKAVRSMAGKRILYVTLNRTSLALRERFAKERIDADAIVFVDTVSSTLHATPANEKNCHFTSSPLLLSEVFGTIVGLDLANFDCLIFDSLSNLSTYDSRPSLLNFLLNLTEHARSSGTKAVFYALKGQSAGLVEDCSKFVDKVVEA